MTRLTEWIPDERQTGEDAGYNWMDTYGDLVTLLLCFFVLLFAMSNIDQNKFERIAGSFRDFRPSPLNSSQSLLFDGKDSVIDLEYSDDYEMTEAAAANEAAAVDEAPGATNGTTDGTAYGADEAAVDESDSGAETTAATADSARAQAAMNTLSEALENYIDEQGLGNTISVSTDRSGIKMIFADSLFFDSGDADLKSGSMQILLDIIPFFENFQGTFKTIKIEGHTDSRPISNRIYKNNWWLSNVRALNVAEYILENSAIDPSKISCEGRGEHLPIADNSTPEGMAKNRRVELVIAM